MVRTDMLYGRPPSGETWHDQRRTGIGGSDAGAVLGVSPHSSALELWQQKRGYERRDEPTERMVWGNRLQNVILDAYEEERGVKITRGRFRRSPEHPWMIGNPDATAPGLVVEVKTTAYKDERWGDDGSPDIPAHYYAQVQHYLVVTEQPAADVVLLVGGREMHVFHVPGDEPFQELMIDAEHTFWQLVERGIAPPPDGSESARRALRELFPVTSPEEITASPEVNEYAREYMAAIEDQRDAERRASLAAQRIQSYMGARERLVGVGYRASWSRVPGRIEWHAVALDLMGKLEAHPDADPPEKALDVLAESFRREPSRRFTLTPKP